MIQPTGCAIIGSGNIGTDLLMKILRHGSALKAVAMAGVDSASDGLARARRLGLAVTHEGLPGLLAMSVMDDVGIVFDATSASSHVVHAKTLEQRDLILVDLTPAAVGPFCVPVVNLQALKAQRNVNMVTCGGQATIPIVHAVSRVAKVHYAEIVASISSKSAGPGTRANIDEFTETTSHAIESVGADEDQIARSIEEIVTQVQAYVPGYRLKQRVQFDRISSSRPLNVPGMGPTSGLKTTVFIEVEGAAHYLPAYAGNLDIMTSAALATGEFLARHRTSPKVAA
jgi:acetaldehyde dehydrogenase